MSETTLIIPDIHLKVDLVDQIIASVKHDKVICLGDVFDDFGDTADLIREAAKWLNKFVDNPNHIMCWGNHDQHYGFPYRTFHCSGYEDWKYFAIRDTIKSSTWEKLKWYHFLDGKWLLSHGGLHKLNVPASILKIRSDRPKFIATISEFLDKAIRVGFQQGAEGVKSWIFNAGAARFGNQRVGGITWCDFEREFYPIRGINQIVGHTPQGMGAVGWCFIRNNGRVEHRYNGDKQFFRPEELDDPDKSFNVDLDVHKDFHYAVWNGKELKISRLADIYKQETGSLDFPVKICIIGNDMNNIAHKAIVLKLNKNWQAVEVQLVSKAICDLINGVVKAVDVVYETNSDGTPNFDVEEYVNPVTWDEWVKLPVYDWHESISSTHMKIRVPTVVICKGYAKVPEKKFKGKPTKEALAIRDNLIDAYTGKELDYDEATKDHVVPLSRGGTDTYDNVVLTTKEINNRKGNQLNSECGLGTMFVEPHHPKPEKFPQTIRKSRHQDWDIVLGRNKK